MLEAYKSHNGAGSQFRGDRYLTLLELRSKLGNRSRSAIYLDLAAGRLPQPIKLGGRLYWPEGEIDAHLRNLRNGEAA
jgi:predicted DNA-binding transcriptional regulator AlpA